MEQFTDSAVDLSTEPTEKAVIILIMLISDAGVTIEG